MTMSTSCRGHRYGAIGLILLLGAHPLRGQPIFTDATAEMGLELDWTSRSIAWGDFDNDGRLDLFRGKNGCCGFNLLHNEGGRFTDRSGLLESIPSTEIGGGVIWGDYDNDGDQDLFVGLGMFLAADPSRNLLLRNDRGVFVEVGQEAGLIDVQPTDNAIWLDYDRDGLLDLYTGNLGHFTGGPDGDIWIGDSAVRNKLYRNQGDGTFADATAAAGLDIELQPVVGGTGSGMAAADFDDDGWTDLYVGNLAAPNRLFLNNRQGGFRDATMGDVADTSQAFGVAVGDIGNDGRLDIFQAAGGVSGSNLPFRSLLLQNLGDGNFLDILEGAGLEALQAVNAESPGLADVDNDGDLDLVISAPRTLFLNTGTGFAEATDRAGFGPRAGGGNYLALADFDRDGFVDLLTQGILYRNNGNDNHWLSVDPVGTASNRDGIGVRVRAVVGELRQTREIMGGNGFNQDPKVAHFGLGDRARVDSLVIRWPSGQVDVLTDIPADQQIRVVEGRGEYHPIEPSRWGALPDTVVLGGTLAPFAVEPALFDPTATIQQVTADLSALGGPAHQGLEPVGQGRYQLSEPIPVNGVNGLQPVLVDIIQATSQGPYWSQLIRRVGVLPAADEILFGDELAAVWSVGTRFNLELTPYTPTPFQDQLALALEATGSWQAFFRPPPPRNLFGYRALRFSFHRGNTAEGRLAVWINNRSIRLLPGAADGPKVDLARSTWQTVEIPLAGLGLQPEEPLEAIQFSGTADGTWYLDDIRLVTAASAFAADTAVGEEHTVEEPQAFSLAQNYPNPFNSGTSIRFALPTAGEVELALYNLAGQQVATLLEGVRPAGAYALQWDGRADGQALASGVYLYRLQTADQVQTRKLLLVR